MQELLIVLYMTAPGDNGQMLHPLMPQPHTILELKICPAPHVLVC
jgi:hypothetical protein